MDESLRRLEYHADSGDAEARAQLLASLLRLHPIDEWQHLAALNDRIALKYLSSLLEIVYSNSLKEENQLWVNAYIRRYDAENAIASFYVRNYETAAQVIAWIQQFYSTYVEILGTITRFLVRVEDTSNIDFDEGLASQTPIHIWDPDYHEPIVALFLVEDYAEVPAEELSEEDFSTQSEGLRWLNVYEEYGANLRYDDGSYGWGHVHSPYATMYLGVLPAGLLGSVWRWQVRQRHRRCPSCDFDIYFDYDDRQQYRYCSKCDTLLEESDEIPLQLISNDPTNYPVPDYLAQAVIFLDDLYNEYRIRPWALDSVHPGTDFYMSLEDGPARSGGY